MKIGGMVSAGCSRSSRKTSSSSTEVAMRSSAILSIRSGSPSRIGDLAQLVGHALLEEAGHPDHAFEAAVGQDELGAEHVELAHAHDARRLQATAGQTGQRREGHAGRRHARILAADDHDAVGLGDDHGDAFEAAARRHGILHDGVDGHFLHLLM